MARIYFDNAATTPIDPKVLEAMRPYLTELFGNSSSIHSYGQETSQAVETAREQVSSYLHCDPKEIIFTSGATESNNLAILGIYRKLEKSKKKLHFITSRIEHPSVLEVFKKLKEWGAEVTFLEVDESGVVRLDKLRSAIQANTVLVSIMYVNNEVGSIQPITEISSIINKERVARGKTGLPIYFHVDGVQAMNYENMDVATLGVDLLSFSGHKIYAPKGIGALYIRRGVSLEPLTYGGHHEFNLRPGTLNVASIVGLGMAVELLNVDKSKNINKIKKIKEKIFEDLQDVTQIRFNGSGDTQSPSILSVSFKKAEGESILMMLDMEGIAISTGSACSSGALEPSHVLTAMGVPVEWTHGSVRISISKNNTEVEAGHLVVALKNIVAKLRQMAPEIAD